MSTIQELLHDLRTQAAETLSQEQVLPIVDAVRTQESLLVAFFTPTKHYFITMEQHIPTAVVFSNRDSFEKFAERCKEQNLFTAAIENTLADRKTLFLDLYRCGFRQIMIDYAPQFIILPLPMFFPIPDDSGLPIVKRSFLNNKLNGHILYLLQQIRSKRGNGTLELETLRELYHSVLLLPSEQFTVNGKTAYHIPNVMQEEKRLCFLYTDFQEWAHSGSREYPPIEARYPQLMELFRNGIDRIVINPGGGAELTLDEKLVTLAEQAAMGEAEGIGYASQQETEQITVTDPEEPPTDLLAALTAVLEAQQDVHTAYLRILKRENFLRPSYLVLLDGNSNSSLHMVLNKAAQPHLGTNDLEFVDCRKVPEWKGTAKPFFKSKKRKLHKK